jgi:hypothetical protein
LENRVADFELDANSCRPRDGSDTDHPFNFAGSRLWRCWLATGRATFPVEAVVRTST